MAKLQTLKPRLVTLNTQHVKCKPAGTQRIRGSALQKIRDRIFTRDNGLCQCTTCLALGRDLPGQEVEHRIPLWAGGVEDDENRYAIASDCHTAKTKCEARMRAAGGWLATPCTCGQHLNAAA